MLAYIFFFAVRLYEVNTLQCYVASNIKEYHTGPVTKVSNYIILNETIKLNHASWRFKNSCEQAVQMPHLQWKDALSSYVANLLCYSLLLQVSYSSSGHLYASASKDGSIKVNATSGNIRVSQTNMFTKYYKLT